MWFLDHVHELRASTPVVRPPSVATAYLVSPPSGGRATVRLWGGEPASVPAQPGVYSGITTVTVQVDGHGRPVLVLGPTTSAPVAEPEPSPTERPSVPDTPETSRKVTRSTTIMVADSGTYSTSFGSWGSWGRSWPGYPYSAGQASVGSSGTLIGAGFYGRAIEALGADEITRARLRIKSVRQGTGPWTPQVRLVTQGAKPSGAPTQIGGTVNGPSLYWYNNPDGWVDLDAAQREALRTGAARGVALVGSTYGVTSGKGTTGLSLALTYKVTA